MENNKNYIWKKKYNFNNVKLLEYNLKNTFTLKKIIISRFLLKFIEDK